MRPTIFLLARSRVPQNENKVPFKVQMPLEIKNKVSSKGSKVKERGCLYEVSVLLACMQQNNFENQHCTKEVGALYQCYSTYLSNRKTTKDHARKGYLTPNAKNLRYNQINQLMARYPHV